MFVGIGKGNQMGSKELSKEDLISELRLRVAEIESLKTRLQHAQDDVRASEDRQRTLLENPIVAVGLSDGNQVLYANRLLLELFGYSDLDELLSVPLIDLVAQSSRAAVLDRLEKSAQGVPYDPTFVCDFRRKDGSVRTIEISVAPYQWKGRPCRFSLFRDITERRRAEEAIRESEAKYRALVETTDTGYVILDLEGRVIDANPEYVWLTGHGALCEILGRQVIEWTASNDIARNAEEVRKCLEQGYVRNLEIDYVNAEGEFTPIEINATTLQTAEGRRILTLCRDITERRRTEEELRKSEQRLRLFMRDAFVIADMAGRIQDFNPAFQQMLGYSAEELGRLTYEQITTERWRDFEAPLVLSQLLPLGYSDVCEKEYRRKGGTLFPVELRRYLIRDVTGEPRAVWAIVRDITERKRAEQALRESEERLRLAAGAAGFGTFSYDLASGRLYCSPEKLALHGLPPGASIDLDENLVPKAVYPEDRAKFLAQLAAAQDPSGSGIIEIEYRIIRADQQIRWLRARGKVIFSADQRPLRADGIVQDTTEHRRAEHQQQLSHDVLECLNRHDNFAEMIEDILQLIKKSTGIEAVAIRLKEGDDFPYNRAIGFPDNFVQMERYLCARDEAGKTIYDTQGKPVLECLCGTVLCGRTNPEHSFFTEGGSFWSSCTTELLASNTKKEYQTRARNRCIRQGYESVALIPLLKGDEIIGLLQLNDHRRNQFTLEMIRFFEGLGSSIGIAFARKQLENMVKESVQRLNELAEQSRTTIWEVDAQGLFTYVSHVSQRSWGYRPDEVVGRMHFYDLHPEEGREAYKAAVFAVVERKQPFRDVVHAVETKDGRIAWGSTNGLPLLNADRTLRGYRGSCTDITERKRTEEALRMSEERFRQVAETVSDFIWEVDVDGLYTYASPSVEKILGYTSDELVGKMHFYDLFVPEIREQLKTAAFEVFETKQRFQAFPNDSISKSGSIVYLETSGVPVMDETGQLLGYRGADTDITDRRQAEIETQLLRQELALFSRIATVGELTTSIAHELNQPLAAILSNAQAALRLMRGGTPDLKELHEIFEDIVADDQRAGNVIRNMRSMLKRDVGERNPLSVNRLVTDIVPIMRNEALTRKIAIILDLGSPMAPVEGNRIQLQQVILNLVVNAFDAMEASEKPRNLALRTRQADGEVMVDVVDSGSGIPADKLKSIFEPFYTTKPNGMGMGLSIARTIIEAHKGRIWAENDPSGGAAFRLALPVSGKGEVAGQQN
jgi:PAS domain S-box-containing protein